MRKKVLTSIFKLGVGFLPLFVLALVGCGWIGSETRNLGDNADISDCGGFVSAQPADLREKQVEEDFCKDERLIWSYNSESRTVSFFNKDVFLNCCGRHSITVVRNKETGVYILEETDRPEPGGVRCGCMCFFDFKIDLPDVAGGIIEVQLYRHVTDNDPRWIVWEGTLDLDQGAGDQIVREDVGYCN